LDLSGFNDASQDRNQGRRLGSTSGSGGCINVGFRLNLTIFLFTHCVQVKWVGIFDGFNQLPILGYYTILSLQTRF
jgi:hypothetical protein